MRETIARWLSPELARKADKHDWLVSEISYNARWLAEFPFVMRTLDRLLDRLHDHFRGIDEPAVGTEPGDISAYREVLRRAAHDAEINRAYVLLQDELGYSPHGPEVVALHHWFAENGQQWKWHDDGCRSEQARALLNHLSNSGFIVVPTPAKKG